MRTSTPTNHPTRTAPTIALLAVTALAAACMGLGPLTYRALQIAGTEIVALAVVVVTARAGLQHLYFVICWPRTNDADLFCTSSSGPTTRPIASSSPWTTRHSLPMRCMPASCGPPLSATFTSRQWTT